MLIDHTTNGFLFTDHAITQKPFDYSAMEAHTVCSVCEKLVKVSDAVPTYKNSLQQTLRFSTLAHPRCAESRKEAIANYRRAK